MRWCNLLGKLPLTPLAVMALLLGLAPFRPEPHLIEKLRLLLSGQLQQTVDIFDLLLHGIPLILLVLRHLAAFTVQTGREPG